MAEEYDIEAWRWAIQVAAMARARKLLGADHRFVARFETVLASGSDPDSTAFNSLACFQVRVAER